MLQTLQQDPYSKLYMKGKKIRNKVGGEKK